MPANGSAFVCFFIEYPGPRSSCAIPIYTVYKLPVKVIEDMGKKTARVKQTPRGGQKIFKLDVPSLAQLGSLAGSSRGSRDGLVTDGCVHLYIHKFCTDGSVYQPYLDPVRLLQLQPRCSGRPNPLYKFQQVIEMYGEAVKKKNPDTEEPFEHG